jgi:tetratricopeptide (TPR) repeat protein
MDAAAHARVGHLYWSDGEDQLAIKHWCRALYYDRSSAINYVNLGKAFECVGEIETALQLYQRCLGIDKNYAPGYLRLACVGDSSVSRANLVSALRLDPKLKQAAKLLAASVLLDRELEDSLRILEEVAPFADRSTLLEAVHGTLIEYGRYAEARRCNRMLLPVRETTALCNLGEIAVAMHDRDTALSCFARASQLDPSCLQAIMGSIQTHLSFGEYEQGWRQFRDAAELIQQDEHPSRRWCGEGVEGKKIVVQTSWSLGDGIQMARYAAALNDEGAAEITLVAKNCLLPLLSQAPGVSKAVGDLEPGERPDLEIPAELYFFYRQSFGRVPYLGRRRRKSGGPLSVGLNWRGRDLLKHNPYKNRSLPLRDFAPLFSVPGIRIFDLQYPKTPEDDAGLIARMEHSPSGISPLVNLAEAVADLDLVISVDTSVAHLAGACGTPTWILLAFSPMDWRWRLSDDDTPWYPFTRLFRQSRPGDWDAVVSAVAAELRTAAVTRGEQ